MSKKLLKHLGGAAIGAAAALVCILLSAAGLLDSLENNHAVSDLRTRLLAHPPAASSPVKLIVLDQPSIEWGTQNYHFTKNWPRNAYAPIIDFCRRGGAKVVAFDVVFQEPSEHPDEDEAFAEAIKNSVPFVAAVMPSDTPVGADSKWPAGAPDKFKLNIDGIQDYNLDMSVAAFSIPIVTNAAAVLGHVRGNSFSEGADPVVRRIHAIQRFDGRVLPSLGLAALAAGEGQTQIKLGDHELQLGERRFPLDGNGRFILRYRRPASGRHDDFTFDTYSAAAVMQSELKMLKGEKPPLDPATFKGAYVFFGFSAPRLFDLTTTPIAQAVPGVEVHATLLDNLLAGDLLRVAPPGTVELATLTMAIAASLAILQCARASRAVILAIAVLPVPIVVAFICYAAGINWPIVAPTLAVALALIGGGVANYATEGKQRLYISRAFQYYLSPQVIEQLLDDPSRLFLGGERRELSIFFSDIRGFTELSLACDPKTLADLLNEYLTDMTDIIMAQGGTLDKYIGDAIVAFWNAPLDQPDHAARACRAAILCQRKLAERRPEYLRKYGHEIHARVGLNTGIVSVGNFGSRDHFDYTIIGDAANLASRLEGANKAFGTITMASETLWDQCAAEFQAREIGRIKVVGRDVYMRVFEPISLKGEVLDVPTQSFMHAQSLCKRGPHYWPEAAAALAAIADDKLAQVYLERLTALQNSGATAWDDSWNMTSK